MRALPIITTILSILGLSSVSARKAVCAMPPGNFDKSCTDIAIKLYLSPDPQAPDTCQLKAVCPTMFAGLPPVSNEVFIPADTELLNVKNQNGTLTHRGQPLGTGGSKITPPCSIPNEDFYETCQMEAGPYPYVSEDNNLATTDLCQVKATCQTLSGNKESTTRIYFNLDLWPEPQIENCAEPLIPNGDGHSCQTKETQEMVDEDLVNPKLFFMPLHEWYALKRPIEIVGENDNPDLILSASEWDEMGIDEITASRRTY